MMVHRAFGCAATLAACALFLTLTACSSRSAAPSSEVLRIAIEQDVKTLDPILASSTVDIFVQRLLFEPLVSADVRGVPVPMLAQIVPSVANGGISRDGLTVVYHLRRSAHWTDGAPVTSDDVKFSWSAIMNPRNDAVSRHGYDDIASIGTPDPATVVVRLKRPFAPFVNTFFAESDQPYAVVPAHVLRAYRDINQVDFNAHPTISDGPFRFVSWAHGDNLVFDRNEHFFMGMPGVRKIEIRVVPDENTSVNLLRTHDIDYMYEPSIVTYPAIRQIPDVRVTWVDANGYVGLQLNMQHAPLNDVRVREAIARAIDKVELARTLTSGQEHVASADLPAWMWASPGLPVLPPDLARANALLRQTGRPGAPLVLVSDVANATQRRLAVEIQSMLHAVGIETELKSYPADLLYAPAGFGGILNGGRFDLAIVPWYAGIDPDNSSQFLCASFPPNGYNESRYCNPEMEALQRAALTTYDQSRRRVAYGKIESLVVRDNPIVPFWWQRQQEALSADFEGFAPNPVTESWNAWQWKVRRPQS
jgi:peptide/nickel transport system substrate-binding protein